jgi:hypothetical protein
VVKENIIIMSHNRKFIKEKEVIILLAYEKGCTNRNYVKEPCIA